MFVPETTKNRIKVYEQKNVIQKNDKLGHYFISFEKYECMKSFSVSPEEIIVSCAGTIGEIYQLPKNAEIGIINQALMKIHLYYLPLSTYFILYFDFVLKTQTSEKGKGTCIKNIPPLSVLKEMLVPLPPEGEILRILDKIKIICTYIDLITKEEQSIKTLSNAFKTKILDYFFGDNSSYKSYYEKEIDITEDVIIFDNLRKPINHSEREKRLLNSKIIYPYYGATGQVGSIDDYIFDGEYVLLGEDGAPFLDKFAVKAYLIVGKSWVNNHVHVIKSKSNNKFLMYYLNWIDYTNLVTGSTRLKLNQANLKKIKYFDVPTEIKNEIVSKIEILFKIIESFNI